MTLPQETIEKIHGSIQIDRLLDTATKLIEIPSPTCSAGQVADCLDKILQHDGFDVERPEAGWPESPAVVARYDTGKPGRTLQFNGHLDTVHLPFVPPRVENGMLYGSGSSDMKGGFAAAIEAARVLKETDLLTGGSILLTAHDLHERPWGDGSQVDELIRRGYIGDAVLLPEYFCQAVPTVGRGMAILEITVTRAGEPMHEMLGGIEQPNVIVAGADIARRFADLDQQLSTQTHPLAGRESIFLGQVHSGEIFNQSPTQLKLAGTRRWLPGTDAAEVEKCIRDILTSVIAETKTLVEMEFLLARDAYEIDEQDPFVDAFQSAHENATGERLPIGAKPFVDDGNTFVQLGGIPAITHGPNATGAHTVNEEVPVRELERVAFVYALTALEFCGG